MNSPRLQTIESADIARHRLAVKAKPRDARAHAMLGVALLRAGRLEEGVAALGRALSLSPSLATLHGVMAPALHQLGQHQAAIDSYRLALQVEPKDPELHKGLADVLRAAGHHEEAMLSAERAIALAPASLGVILTHAGALFATSRFEEAERSFRQALGMVPDNLDVRMDLGVALMRLERFDEAAECFTAVLERDPMYSGAYLELGRCRHAQDRRHDAIAIYQQALERFPDHPQLLADLGTCQKQVGEFAEACATLERCVELGHPGEDVLRNLGYCYFELGDWALAQRYWRQVLEVAPTPAAHSSLLFLLSHSLSDGAALTAEHFRFGEVWEQPLIPLRKPHPNTRDPQRPIRVGFVSPDLHSHAVAQFIAPVFALLKNSSAVIPYVFYNNSIEDTTNQMLRNHVPRWHSIDGMSDEAAEELIRSEEIDILIDLAGHSALNRLPLFARKPAPVQASWIGYAGTTGLQAMDYYLCDQFYLPEGRYDDQFSEKIVRMPLIAPFLPHALAPAVSPLPALSKGHITFGSFHRANKVSREVIAQWAKLLHAVPDAKMLLGGLRGQDGGLVRWFEEEGIARERLILRERTDMATYLGQHAEVDICLSPFPYTGATTVCHALWMGVPTLTTIGPTNPSHAALGYLAHLGLSSFLADDEASFIKLGVFLSQNLSTLAALRASMRERFTSSVIGYPAVVAAGLELALRKMWVQWCDGKEPEHLRVRLSELAAQ